MKTVIHLKQGKFKKCVLCAGVLLAAAMIWLLCRDGVAALYWVVCNALIDAWGITSRNIARAHWFARMMIQYGTLLAEGLGGALLMGITLFFRRRFCPVAHGQRRAKAMARGALTGGIGMAALWCFFCATGTMRLARGTGALLEGAAQLLTSSFMLAARLIFFYDLVYPVLKGQLGRTKAGIIMLLGALIFTAWEDSTRLLCLVNALGMALLCLMDCEKESGIGYMLGWRLALAVMMAGLGLPLSDNVLFETYLVNSVWLNGGSYGVMAGLGMTFLLAAFITLWVRRLRRRPS